MIQMFLYALFSTYTHSQFPSVSCPLGDRATTSLSQAVEDLFHLVSSSSGHRLDILLNDCILQPINRSKYNTNSIIFILT